MSWNWQKITLCEPAIDQVADIATRNHKTVENVLDEMRRMVDETTEAWTNGIYRVSIREIRMPPPWPTMNHLLIGRRDKAPVGKERFRDFQRIKNELVGTGV